nr:uncharacterized protein LOC102069031 isoform X2 [Zonotrichia albicollis]
MLPIQKPGSGRRGPPRGKNKATGQKKPHEPSEHMREMLKEMQQAGQDEVAAKASPLDWLNKVLKPLEPPSDVSAGRTFPAPLLIPTEKPGSNRWGPLRGKNKTPGHKKPHELNNILERMVTELPKGNGMDREALWKVAFPAGREAMPGTATGVMGQKSGQKEVFP